VITSHYAAINYTPFTNTYPHSTSLPLYTLQIPPRLNSLYFNAFSWPSPRFEFPYLPFTSFQFTSIHVSLSNLCSSKYSNSSVLQTPPPPHFTSINSFLTFSLYILDHPALHIHFNSLHFTYPISAPFPRNTRFSPHFEYPSLPFTSLHEIHEFLLTSNSLHFTSLHLSLP